MRKSLTFQPYIDYYFKNSTVLISQAPNILMGNNLFSIFANKFSVIWFVLENKNHFGLLRFNWTVFQYTFQLKTRLIANFYNETKCLLSNFAFYLSSYFILNVFNLNEKGPPLFFFLDKVVYHFKKLTLFYTSCSELHLKLVDSGNIDLSERKSNYLSVWVPLPKLGPMSPYLETILQSVKNI